MDLNYGYHEVPIEHFDVGKTAFKVEEGLFQMARYAFWVGEFFFNLHEVDG